MLFPGGPIRVVMGGGAPGRPNRDGPLRRGGIGLLSAGVVVALLAAAALAATTAAARADTTCCFELSASARTAYVVDYGDDGCIPTYDGNIRFKTYELENLLDTASIVAFGGGSGGFEVGERRSRTSIELAEFSTKTKPADDRQPGQPCYAENSVPEGCPGAEQVNDDSGNFAFFAYDAHTGLNATDHSVNDSFGTLHLGPGDLETSRFRARCLDGSDHGFGDSFDFFVKPPKQSFVTHASPGDRCVRRRDLVPPPVVNPHDGGIPYLTHTWDGDGRYVIRMSYFPRSDLHREKKRLRAIDYTAGDPTEHLDGWGTHGSGNIVC